MLRSASAATLTIAAVLILSSCTGGGTKEPPVITNSSPVAEVPDTSAIPPIAASVVVRSRSAEDLIDNDLVTELKFQETFTEVLSGRTGASGDLVLTVSSNSEASDGTGESVAQGIAQGLTFGIAGAFQTDNASYRVTVDADLTAGGRSIGTYRTEGRIDTEIADGASLAQKQDLAVKRVNLAFKHALELLAAEIALDRDEILAAL